MINLRNSSLRARDIRKLIGYKPLLVKWDWGIQEEGEWNQVGLKFNELHGEMFCRVRKDTLVKVIFSFTIST